MKRPWALQAHCRFRLWTHNEDLEYGRRLPRMVVRARVDEVGVLEERHFSHFRLGLDCGLAVQRLGSKRPVK